MTEPAEGASPAASALAPQRRREVLHQAWSGGTATGVYAIGFGTLAVAAGLSIWQAQVLSLLMSTGGSQFAFVSITATGGGAAPVAVPPPPC